MATKWRLRASKLRLWPDEEPQVEKRMHGWVHRGNEALLRRLIASRRPRIIVELGSWLGLSTTLLLEETEAQLASVFSVDMWDAELLRTCQAEQYTTDPEAQSILNSVPLFSTFLANLWDYRHRLFPLRMSSLEGLACIQALEAPVDMIYVDADHSYNAVLADLQACHAKFPRALIVGDDWQWPEVRKAVRQFTSNLTGIDVVAHPRENWWFLESIWKHISIVTFPYDYV
ncbi:MAG: hypothetical protein SGPRY_007102 [Prymnesium sp.]